MLHTLGQFSGAAEYRSSSLAVRHEMPVLAHPGDALFESVQARDRTTERDHISTSAWLEEPDVITIQQLGGVVCRRAPDVQRRHAKPMHVAEFLQAPLVRNHWAISPHRDRDASFERPPECLSRSLSCFGESVL